MEQSFDHFYPKVFCLPQIDRKHLLVKLEEAEGAKGLLRNLELWKRHGLSEAENEGSERINARQ